MTFLERSYGSRSCFDGSMSIHFLSRNGIVVVPVDSLGCGFAFAFDLAATTLGLVRALSSSCESAGFSVLSSIESITYLTVP